MSHCHHLFATPLYTQAPAIRQNIHGSTEALLWRRNKALAVAEWARSNALWSIWTPLSMCTWKCKQEKLQQVALGLPVCTPWTGIFLKTMILTQQQKTTAPAQEHCCHERNLRPRQPHCAFSSEITGSYAHKTTLYSTPSTAQATDFVLPEDISPVPILRNKRSGRGGPTGSAKMLTCSPYKRKSEESIKKWKLFQPVIQETKRLRRKWKGILDQQVSKPTRLKKIVIRQRISFVHTAKEGSVMMCKERYRCNETCARTGALKNVQGQTRTNSYAITARRTNRL